MLAALLLAAPPSGVTGGHAEPHASRSGRESEAHLAVMSFNIRYGTADDGENSWPHRREAVIGVVEEHAPHVLGLQEALGFQLEEMRDALPRYRRLGVGRADGGEEGEHAAILVDAERLEVLEQGTFWFSDTPGFPGSTSWGNDLPRICTWARLRDRETGRSFAVYNLHWDHRSQPSRERSAELLAEVLAGRAGAAEPVIVTGDFNAGETNPAFRRLLGSPEPGLVDTFRVLHPDATEVGTFNGFAGVTGGPKIDAVLVSEQWEVVAAGIVRARFDGRYPSDHFPVVATVALPPPP